MAVVVLAWELGGGHGHVASLRAVGTALRERGHTTIVATRNLQRAEAAFGGTGTPILQAPIGWPPRRPLPVPRVHAAMLRLAGYEQPAALGPLYRAWRVLLESVGASLVVGDFAPTALLAARGLGIPRVALGTGYAVPPLSSPTPALRPWEGDVTREDAQHGDGHVLQTINRVLARCGDTPLVAMHELYDADARFVLSFPALDHFAPRDDARYWGTLASGHSNAAPEWPAGTGPRVFAYLDAGYSGLTHALRQFASLGRPTLVVARDLSRSADLPDAPNVRIVPTLVNVDVAVAEASVVVSHGGHGTASRALLGGCPLLVLPQHDEQALLGHRLASQQLAINVGPRQDIDHDLCALLTPLLEGDTFRNAAAAFARRHRDHDQASAVAAIGRRCEALIRAG